METKEIGLKCKEIRNFLHISKQVVIDFLNIGCLHKININDLDKFENGESVFSSDIIDKISNFFLIYHNLGFDQPQSFYTQLEIRLPKPEYLTVKDWVVIADIGGLFLNGVEIKKHLVQKGIEKNFENRLDISDDL